MTTRAFPDRGKSRDDVLAALTDHKARDLATDGRAFAFVYDSGEETRKLAREAARLVTPGGFLLIASCSHLVDPAAFAAEVARGLAAASRQGRILRQAGAGADHPVHPHLPESAYLKVMVLQLD